jgi:hypothetical protein
MWKLSAKRVHVSIRIDAATIRIAALGITQNKKIIIRGAVQAKLLTQGVREGNVILGFHTV